MMLSSAVRASQFVARRAGCHTVRDTVWRNPGRTRRLMTVDSIGRAEFLLFGLIGFHDASEEGGSDACELDRSVCASWWKIRFVVCSTVEAFVQALLAVVVSAW